MKKLTIFLAFLLFAGFQVAAQMQISGTVTGEDGLSIPGVSVWVKDNQTIGTTTDLDGKYSLSVPSDAQVLVFSFVGMKTIEEPINGRSVINITMVSDVLEMEQVVVTALGISREKKALGYAVQDVQGEEITKARETNVINSLQGRISGAQITSSSGAVGASTRIVLRGAKSLGGDNQPLFVVDGIPIDNSNFGNTGTDGVNRGSGAGDINPEDIESISVLKGPNAAALYGSRASNGVILITTKKGKAGEGFGVSFTNTTTFSNPLKLPDYQNSYGQGTQGNFEFVDGAGGGVNDGTDESWGPQLDVGLMIPQFDSPVDPVTGVREATPWISHPDNVKNFYETGMHITNNLAVTGGNDKSNFRVSYTNSQQTGMVPNTDETKNIIALSGSSNPHERLKISAGANYVGQKSDNQPGYGYDAQNVVQQFNWFGRQVDISKLEDYTNEDGSKYNWNYNYHNNPYFTLYENVSKSHRDRIYGNARLDFEFTDYLKAFVRTGGDYYTSFASRQMAHGDIDNPNGYYSESMTERKEINTDFLLMFNKGIESLDLNININAGASRMDKTIQQTVGTAPELAVPGVYNVANSLVAQQTSNFHSKKRINSVFISGQFAWRNALFLDFTGRNDWSSTLPEDNNSYFYPSVTLSGLVTDLLDIKSDVLSFAKLRAGWAQVGSDTDPYQLVPYLDFGDGWNASTKLLNQFVPNTLPNAELKPQFITSIEVGADLRFFLDRIRLDATYYDITAKDQILAIPISSSSGYTTQMTNAGELRNKGIELLLGLTPVKSKDFEWDITLNWSKNTNEVVELAEGIEQYEIGSYWSMKVMAIPGEKYGSLYGYDFDRDPNGNIIYYDGLPHQGDLKILGNYTPDWNGGMNNSITYKGINLSFLIDMQKGGDIYSMTTTWGRYAGVLEETVIGREDGIVGNGVKPVYDTEGNVTGYAPNDVVVDAENFNKNAYSNDIGYSSVFDATYVKLREVKLSYTITKLGKLPFKSIDIALVGRNLALLYSTVPHIDPETSFSNTNVQGLEFGQLPSARSYGFSLNFKL